MYLGLYRSHFLSPTGNCKPWDASADGYCQAEGREVFELKLFSDAIVSSGNILGVIRATEVNQSASAVSITRPLGSTREALLRLLMSKSGVRPEEVSLLDAHGTETQGGDPEELKSLRAVLSPDNGSYAISFQDSKVLLYIRPNHELETDYSKLAKFFPQTFRIYFPLLTSLSQNQVDLLASSQRSLLTLFLPRSLDPKFGPP